MEEQGECQKRKMHAIDEEQHMFFRLVPILGAGHVGALGAGHVAPTQEPAAYYA